MQEKSANITKNFANMLKQAREARGFTQQEMADLLEVSLRSVQNWESGTQPPGNRRMRRIDEKLRSKDELPINSTSKIQIETDDWKSRAVAAETKLEAIWNLLNGDDRQTKS